MLEDVNVEHLLNVFTSIDTNSGDVWDARINFMKHLFWHKRRPSILRPKIEGLPDDHRSKPGCLFQLSRLFRSAGNSAEEKWCLTHALKLGREQGGDLLVAHLLTHLSSTNQQLGFREEGILQAKEALNIFEQLGDIAGQASCVHTHAFSLYNDGQFDAAEEATHRSIEFLPEKGEEFLLSRSHRLLGDIHRSKSEREKATHHFEVALGIAFPFDWHFPLFWIHHSLASLSLDEDRLKDAEIHLTRARSYATNDIYCLGRACLLQARLGASWELNCSRRLIQRVEQVTEAAFRVSDSSGAG